MHQKLLDEMQWLCKTVQDMGSELKVRSNMKPSRDMPKMRNSRVKCATEWMKGSKLKKVPEK